MKEFKGSLGNYKIIATDDNTETIWSEYFDENCHNLSGAKEETIYNYIEGCEIGNLIKEFQTINIFDVGFGPGLGLLYLIKSIPINTKINYFSIEIDLVLLEWALKNNFSEVIYEIKEADNLKYVSFDISGVKATIFIGDGRLTIPKARKLNLISNIHAIFQDPFSPKKNPTLWTVEWFNELKSMSNPEVRLSTYSSSVSIRKSLIAAGFKIENRKGFGNKRTMTKAKLTGETSQELLNELSRTQTLPLHDN
jgi:tRNA U34 5-methylaminomethyl-2-thiouridine-forming methyltransferase MnmC